MNKVCWIFGILVNFSLYTYALSSNEREIMRIYNNAVYYNKVDIGDINFLKSINNDELTTYTDSVQYCFHYSYAGLLDMIEPIDVELQNLHIDQALQICETKIGIFDAEYVELLKARAENADDQGYLDTAISYFQQALVKGNFILERESTHRNRFEKGTTLCGLGNAYIKKGYEKEALRCFREAHEIMKVDYSQDDIMPMMPLFYIAEYYDQQKKDYKSSIMIWEELIDFLESNGTIDGKYYYDWNFQLAADLVKAGLKEEGYKKYCELFKLIKEKEGSYSQELEHIYENYFFLLHEMGLFAEVEEFKPILKDYYEKTNAPSGQYAYALYQVARILDSTNQQKLLKQIETEIEKFPLKDQIQVLVELGRNPSTSANDAVSYSKQLLSLIEKQPNGREYPIYGIALEMLAISYEKIPDSSKALDTYLHLKEFLEQRSEVDSTYYWATLGQLSRLYFDQKNYREAINYEELLQPYLAKLYGKNAPRIGQGYNDIGVSYLNLGEYKKAEKALMKSLDIVEKSLGIEHSHAMYATIIHNLGRLYMLEGKNDKAMDYFQRALNLQLTYEGKSNFKTIQYINELETMEL